MIVFIFVINDHQTSYTSTLRLSVDYLYRLSWKTVKYILLLGEFTTGYTFLILLCIHTLKKCFNNWWIIQDGDLILYSLHFLIYLVHAVERVLYIIKVHIIFSHFNFKGKNDRRYWHELQLIVLIFKSFVCM